MNYNVRGSLDLNKNQVYNIVLHNVATTPSAASGIEGQLVFNTTDDKVYYHNGTAWVAISPTITINDGGNNGMTITNTDGVYDFSINVDNATLEIVGDQVRIKDGGVTTDKIANLAVTEAKIANNAVTNVKIANNAVTFAKIQDIPTMTIIGNLSGTTTDPSAISVINTSDMSGASATNIATAGSIKAYVDAKIAGLGNLEGAFDANTATSFPSTAATQTGDYWYVTVAGTVNGISLNVGDVLIANKPNASTTSPNDWIFLETNRDQATTTTLGLVKLSSNAIALAGTNTTDAITPAALRHVLDNRKATESSVGTIEIATQAEVNAGTDDERAITPKKLKEHLTQYTENSISINWTSGSTFTATHAFNSLNVAAHVYNKDGEEELVPKAIVNATTIRFEATPPPTTAAPLRIVILK